MPKKDIKHAVDKSQSDYLWETVVCGKCKSTTTLQAVDRKTFRCPWCGCVAEINREALCRK